MHTFLHVRGVNFVSVSPIVLLNFGTVLAVWHYFHVIAKRPTKLKTSIISYFVNIMLEITCFVVAYHIPCTYAYAVAMSCQLKQWYFRIPEVSKWRVRGSTFLSIWSLRMELILDGWTPATDETTDGQTGLLGRWTLRKICQHSLFNYQMLYFI